eukprot:COSAG01_NODE_105_length_26080_cov_7.640237_6_plen_141_part_00
MNSRRPAPRARPASHGGRGATQMPLSLLIVALQPAAAATNGGWYPCTFNREFVQWTGAAAQCTPGAPVPCVTSSDCAALPGACCPHYGPGQGSCGFLGCLRADGTNTSAFCGTTITSPAKATVTLRGLEVPSARTHRTSG